MMHAYLRVVTAARRYDAERRAFLVRLPAEAGQGSRGEFALAPAVVRRNDTSARSVNEWTGEKMLRDSDVLDDIEPASVQPLGNYAVQITWQDGFNQARGSCPPAYRAVKSMLLLRAVPSLIKRLIALFPAAHPTTVLYMVCPDKQMHACTLWA